APPPRASLIPARAPSFPSAAARHNHGLIHVHWVTGMAGRQPISCGRATVTSSPRSKSAVADFDRFIEWPKPAYTRFRLGEGWGGGSGGCGDAVPPLSTPTPNPSPQGGGGEFAALLRRKLAPRCKLTPINVAPAAKAVLAGVLLVLNPIRRSCLHMLPPARSCVVRLWALFATRSPVCSVSATDSKCIQTALDYTDGGGICAAPGRRDKRREAHRAFLPVPNRPPEESMTIKQALCVGTALGFAMLAASVPIAARAQQPAPPAVAAPPIDGDDIGGIVTSRFGPEPGG